MNFKQAVLSWPEASHKTWHTYFGEMFIQLGNNKEGTELEEYAAKSWLEGNQFKLEDVIPVIWLREHRADDK